MWTVLAVLGCVSLIVSDNLAVVLPPTFAATFFISVGNAPGSVHHSGDLFASYRLPWLVVLAGVIVVCFASHIAIYGSFSSLKTKPKFLLLFSIPMVLAMFCSGIANPERLGQDTLFPLILALCWVGFYLIYAWGIQPSRESREYFFTTCFVIAMGLVVEIAYVYLIEKSVFYQTAFFGWGVSNNYGGIMALLLPVAFYLATTRRFGWCFYLGGLGIWAAIFFSTSRGALLVGSLIFVVCLVLCCFRNPHKRLYRIFLGALVLLGLAALFIFPDFIKSLVPRYDRVGWADSGRFGLWSNTLAIFAEYPIFGGGFFSIPFTSYVHPEGAYRFIPGFAHNTIVELLGAGGLFLLLTYLVYRGATIWRFARRITWQRIFLGLVILSLLGTSMLDNHLFNIYPAFFYAAALALGEQDYLAQTKEGAHALNTPL